MWKHMFWFSRLYLGLIFVINLSLTLWGRAKLFIIALTPLYITSSSAWVLPFLYILTNTCCCYIFGEASIQVLFLFLNCFVVVELSLYILDVNPLSNICYKIFSNSMGCVFTLDNVLWCIQKFLLWCGIPVLKFQGSAGGKGLIPHIWHFIQAKVLKQPWFSLTAG